MKKLSVAASMLVVFVISNLAGAAPYAYITRTLDGTVAVYDTVKNKKVTTITVGGAPFTVVMSPDGTRAYVTSQDFPNGRVSAIDVLTHSVSGIVSVGPYPFGAAILPDGSRLYIADQGITVINTSTLTIDATIPYEGDAYILTAHPDGSRVYMTDYGGNSVAVIDTATHTVTRTVPVGEGPSGIAVHPDGTRAYVANDISQTISVIDTSSNTVTETISLPGYPDQIAFAPSGAMAYVTSWEGGGVWVIDTNSRTVLSTIGIGPTDGGGVDVSPDGAHVYVVTNYFDETRNKRVNDGVKVIDAATNTVKKKIKVPGGPMFLGKFIGGPQFHVVVHKAGSGTGKVISKNVPDIDCGATCEADFYVNRKVQLQAIPAEDSVFSGWSGACTRKAKTCRFIAADNYAVTATFDLKQK